MIRTRQLPEVQQVKEKRIQHEANKKTREKKHKDRGDKFKGKVLKDLSQKEKDLLLEHIGVHLGILAESDEKE